jgi:hypothetical protein
MSTHQNSSGAGRLGRPKFWLRGVVVAAIAACSATAHAATITVNSLLDDVFPDAVGAIAVPLTAAKCTLRMAIASANLDLAVGGATFGCAAAPSTTYVIGGADTIAFDPTLANGTILLDATQAMNVGAVINNVDNILYITGPTTIDGAAAVSTNITLDGGSAAATTAKRILAVSEAAPSGATLVGSSIWVNLFSLNFQNARAETAGACVLSFENLRVFSASFSNCVATNTPTVAVAAGGALFVRAPNNTTSTFRPDVRLTRVSFKGNKALAGGSTNNPGGGAFYLGSGSGRVGNVVLTDVIVGGPNVADQNYADGGYGGGSITRAETVTISNSTFQGNVAQNGEVGGLRINSMSGEGAAVIINSKFLDNRSKTNGGGLNITSNTASPVLLRDVTVTGNSAQRYGGADINNNAAVTISNSTFSNNVASAQGGGINVSGNTGAVAIDDVIISGNRTTDGTEGGFLIRDNLAAVQMRRATISNNEVRRGTAARAASGAGTFAKNVSVTLTDSTVSGNSSDYHIGALGLDASFSPYDGATGLPLAVLPPTTNSITFDRVTISGNTTTGTANGGAGYSMNYISSPGLYTIQNSTITGNTAVNSGGAAFTFQGFNPSTQTNALRVVIRNSTIARNTSNNDEALNFGTYNSANPSSQNPFNGSLVLESSVLGGRQAINNPVSLIGGPAGLVATITNSLIENNGNPFSAQCGVNGNLCAVDAKLDALASHGGPTQTLRLLAGSPAINAGSNSTSQATDQRGAARLQGSGVDMGAYETPAGSAVACNLDMDGDSLLSPTKEGLVLVRAMLGFVGNAVTAGTGLTRSWVSIRADLNANCGTNYTQ